MFLSVIRVFFAVPSIYQQHALPVAAGPGAVPGQSGRPAAPLQQWAVGALSHGVQLRGTHCALHARPPHCRAPSAPGYPSAVSTQRNGVGDGGFVVGGFG